MGKKQNPVLAAYEAKLEAQYRRKLSVTMQMCFDVAVITANDVFKMGAGRAKQFEQKYSENYAKICAMLLEDESDPDLVYSREKIDERLKMIVGEENFASWDERYGVRNGIL